MKEKIFWVRRDDKGWMVVAETVEGKCPVVRGPEELFCEMVASRLNEATQLACEEIGYLLEAAQA